MNAGTPASAVPLDLPAAPASPLAIIAGGGSLPVAVAQAAQKRGRGVVMFPVRGWADPSVEAFAHHWIAPVQAGRHGRVHEVVDPRDAIEHRSHLDGLERSGRALLSGHGPNATSAATGN